MAKIKWKGGTLLAPLPAVMVTCSDGTEDNIITVAWTGIISSEPAKTYISVRPSRHSYEIIKKSGVFAINLTPASLVKKADYCGIYTGKKVNKFEKCRFTKEKATEIDCPIIGESPLVLECRVTDVIPLGSHDMFIADIVACDVDEKLIDASGKLRIEKAGLAAFAHGAYFELGRKLGDFGCSVKNKHKKNEGKSGKPKQNKTKKASE